MPDIDLEPGDYREPAKREPILHPRWKWGLLALAGVMALKVLILWATASGPWHH